jgi:hypothetical protein
MLKKLSWIILALLPLLFLGLLTASLIISHNTEVQKPDFNFTYYISSGQDRLDYYLENSKIISRSRSECQSYPQLCTREPSLFVYDINSNTSTPVTLEGVQNLQFTDSSNNIDSTKPVINGLLSPDGWEFREYYSTQSPPFFPITGSKEYRNVLVKKDSIFQTKINSTYTNNNGGGYGQVRLLGWIAK